MGTYVPCNTWQMTNDPQLVDSSFGDPFCDPYMTSVPQTQLQSVFSPPQHITTHQMVSPVSAQPHSSTDLGCQPYVDHSTLPSRPAVANITEYVAPESSSDHVEKSRARKRGSKRLCKDRCPCLVCGDVSSGIHYGCRTCEGCKGFFRRTIEKKKVTECKNRPLGSCKLIGQDERNKCAFCRLMKCFLIGMSRNCSKLGRARKDSTEDGSARVLRTLTLEEFYARMEEEHQLFQAHKMNRIAKKRTKSESSVESRVHSNESAPSLIPEELRPDPSPRLQPMPAKTNHHRTKPSKAVGNENCPGHAKVNNWLNTVAKPEPLYNDNFNWEADLNDIKVQPLDPFDDLDQYCMRPPEVTPPSGPILTNALSVLETPEPVTRYRHEHFKEPYPTTTSSSSSSFFASLGQNCNEPQNYRSYLNSYNSTPFSEPVMFDSNGINPSFDKSQQWFHQWFQVQPSIKSESSNPSVETSSFMEFLTIENAIMGERELAYSKQQANISRNRFDYNHCLPQVVTGLNTNSQIALVDELLSCSSADCVVRRSEILTDHEVLRVRESLYDNFKNFGPPWKTLMTSLINLGLGKLYILFTRTDRATKVVHRFSNLMCPVNLHRIRFRDLASRSTLFGIYSEYISSSQQRYESANRETYNRIYSRLVNQIDFVFQTLSKRFLASNFEKSNMENKSNFVSLIRRIVYLEKFTLLALDMSSDIERERIPSELRVRSLLKAFSSDVCEHFDYQSIDTHAGNLLFDRKFVDILQKMQFYTILFPVRSYHKCPAAFHLKTEGSLHVSCLMFAYRVRCMQRSTGRCYDPESQLFFDETWNKFIGFPLVTIIIGIAKLLDSIFPNTDLFLFTYLLCGSLPAHLHFPDTEINRRVMMCVVDFYEDYVCFSNIENAFNDLRKVFAVRAMTEIAFPYLCDLISRHSDVLDPIFHATLKTISCPQKVLGTIPHQNGMIFNSLFANSIIMSGLERLKATSLALTRWDTINSRVTPEGSQMVCVYRWDFGNLSSNEPSVCSESGQMFSIRETPTTPPTFRQPLPLY